MSSVLGGVHMSALLWAVHISGALEAVHISTIMGAVHISVVLSGLEDRSNKWRENKDKSQPRTLNTTEEKDSEKE